MTAGWIKPDNEFIRLFDGRDLRVHPATACEGGWCCIHNPSEHRLAEAPLNWRSDRGLMERFCEHGVGHPDPDDLAWKRVSMPDYDAWAFGVHGCDGCCRKPRA